MRNVPAPVRNAAGMVCSVAGPSAGPTLSRPRPVAPSIQLSSSNAVMSPPLAVTCTAGLGSPGASASTSTPTRPCGGTATREPLIDGTGPLAPRTWTSTLSALAPELLTTRRSRRVAAPPPASNHTSDRGVWQVTAWSPRSSPSRRNPVWRAATPAANPPRPVTAAVDEPDRAPEITLPRVEDVASAAPDGWLCAVSEPGPETVATPVKATTGAVAANTVTASPVTGSSPEMPSVSGPGQSSTVSLTGAATTDPGAMEGGPTEPGPPTAPTAPIGILAGICAAPATAAATSTANPLSRSAPHVFGVIEPSWTGGFRRARRGRPSTPTTRAGPQTTGGCWEECPP